MRSLSSVAIVAAFAAPSTPAEPTAYMRSETERWSKVIKTAGLAIAQ